MINKLIRFCLENKLVVLLFTAGLIFWGVMVAPFDWESEHFPRDPVPVDAIPDIGENQQIVFTEWMGRSPQYSPRMSAALQITSQGRSSAAPMANSIEASQSPSGSRHR